MPQQKFHVGEFVSCKKDQKYRYRPFEIWSVDSGTTPITYIIIPKSIGNMIDSTKDSKLADLEVAKHQRVVKEEDLEHFEYMS